MKPTKRFEEDGKITTVSCAECENFYTGACDGRTGECNSYMPTRHIRIDEELRKIKYLLGIAVAWIALTCAIAITTLKFCLH